MNALHPPPASDLPVASQPWRDASRASRLVSRLALFYLAITLVLLAMLAAPRPLWAEFLHSGLGGIAAAAILLPLAGLLATAPLTVARARFGSAQALRWKLLRRRFPRLAPAFPVDPELRLGRLARRPQGVIVPALALSAIALAWLLRPGTGDVGSMTLGAIAICAGFPLLVAERIMSATDRAMLPEADGLQGLLFVPMLLIPVAGLLEIGAGLGLWWTRPLMTVVGVFVGLVALELTARALANWFLPPPPASEARAAVTSAVALLLQPRRLAPEGLGAPIRNHLGIDFSRSWALRYARSAALPIGFALALIAWGLTGINLVSLDQRGIYERLGKPVAVWAPGAHLGLPWPLGRVRPVDLGVVHAVLLGGDGITEASSPAEAPPPASADRLWDQVHPSEVSYLIASRESDGQQGFQSVNLDLRVLYRIGLDETSALRAAYAVNSPDALVRSEAGRLMARVFANQELPAVLGAGRETMAENLRTQLQSELDRFGSGIELVAVVIEAVHPPAGAAEAYHNVQAAEIIANTAIATERGRAQATASRARQMSTDLTYGATGTAADTVGLASVQARTFTADQDAWRSGGSAFLLERYFANLIKALPKSPLVIVDHRLAGPNAPSVDLRSFGAPTGRTGDDD